jgi:hypothetical protein
MTIHFEALSTQTARALRAGAPDAYGNRAEVYGVSDGQGVPCRHCLRNVPAGQGVLVLAWRPFSTAHPYAETGPIFLCAEDCASGAGGDLPASLTASPDYLVKAYSADERIIYGTGGVIPADEIRGRAETLLSDPGTAFVDVRSARNNCFLARITRG